MSELIKAICKMQDTIFEATARDNANWLRFAEGGAVHRMILAGELEGVTETDIQRCGETGCLVVRVPARDVRQPSEGYRRGVEAEQEDWDDPSWGAAYGDGF